MTVLTSHGEAVNELNKALDEIERLRSALDEIAFATDIDDARRIASAALNQQDTRK
jgi:hypothetical protein